MVLEGGVEPPRSFGAPDFESGASTNSATPAGGATPCRKAYSSRLPVRQQRGGASGICGMIQTVEACEAAACRRKQVVEMNILNIYQLDRKTFGTQKGQFLTPRGLVDVA